MTVIIDPGHGGVDPGAVAAGELEKNWTLKISLYQRDRFKQLGIPVSMTREDDRTLDSGPRTSIVKNSGAKYCISNHLNAGGGDRGEVIHSIYNDGKLANRIKDALVDAGQTAVKVYSRESGKAKGKDYYYMHRETGSVTTIIVEYCFIDNPADFAHFKANWQDYAEAVVRAFCMHIDHDYNPPQEGTHVIETPEVPEAEVNVEVWGVKIDDGKLIDGTTYVPLRAISNALGLPVSWDQATRTARILKKGE